MEEFKIIDSAASAEVLKKKLKNDVLEQYGVFFEPKTVYDALLKFDGLRGTTRFEHMKVGKTSHFLVWKVMLTGTCSVANSRTPRNSLVSSLTVCMRNVSVPCTWSRPRPLRRLPTRPPPRQRPPRHSKHQRGIGWRLGRGSEPPLPDLPVNHPPSARSHAFSAACSGPSCVPIPGPL